MSTFKKLAGDTAIYGMSSIVGRVLTWCLTPYYSFVFLTDEFGVMTNLYSYAAILLVILTYGMETSFFRYASKSEKPDKVYSTALISIIVTSLFFLIGFIFLKSKIAALIQFPEHPEYILWFAIILALDAFSAIPFAQLRIQKRPLKFAFLKLVNIALTIVFNIFFLTFCPWLLENNPDSFVNLFYSPETGVGYVFIANLLASIITTLMLLPEILKVKLQFDKEILRQLFNYGLPIMIVGIAGMISQSIDKILIPFLLPEAQNPLAQLGIYGANFKMAVLMNMFIQAFRYAFEPFFFSRANSKDDTKIYASIMNYFVIFGLIIFLGMTLYIDILKVIIEKEYHSGLQVVPIILMANLFYGIYFVQSLWYKLTDKTKYGAYQSIIGAVVAVSLNFLLIPVMGYMGSAVALFVSYLVIMVISYFAGQKYFPIPYNLKRIGTYFLVAIVLYAFSFFTARQSLYIKLPVHSVLLLFFVYFIFKLEKLELQSLFKFSKKN